MLHITKGCQCRHHYYSSIVSSYVSLVLIQYMMLAVIKCSDVDERTIGELFFYMCDQMADISAHTVLALIIKAVFDDIPQSFCLVRDMMFSSARTFPSLKNLLDIHICLSESDRTRLMDIFLKHLPDTLGENLKASA
ncbi:MAG: hypothetical protein LKE40_12635 [Spirochaetia bacterium]|nr:hypothetical protein [Spirochaetia bacterium]